MELKDHLVVVFSQLLLNQLLEVIHKEVDYLANNNLHQEVEDSLVKRVEDFSEELKQLLNQLCHHLGEDHHSDNNKHQVVVAYSVVQKLYLLLELEVLEEHKHKLLQ